MNLAELGLWAVAIGGATWSTYDPEVAPLAAPIAFGAAGYAMPPFWWLVSEPEGGCFVFGSAPEAECKRQRWKNTAVMAAAGLIVGSAIRYLKT